MTHALAPQRPVAPAVQVALPPAASPGAPGRLLSLDVFRGLTIAGMLLVNNPGTWSAVYPPLKHAEWHGWTPTDLIFPFFLFIVGVAMTWSFGAQLARGASTGRVFARAAKRSAILFLLGLLLAAFPYYDLDLARLRIPGVLQRIAVCYLFASVVVLFAGLRAQVAVAAALMLGYWALMMLVPVPGGGAGDLSQDGSLAAYVDRLVLTPDHLWVQSKTWDPEGVLSTLPAIATVLLGVFAGCWIRGERTPAERAVGLFFAGNVALILGWIWNAAFPINKNLWTSSYVVFTAGMALNGLAMCYWLVDVRGWKRWARPFAVFGTNAIAAFFLSGIFARLLGMVKVGETTLKGWTFDNAFASWLSPVDASLAFAISFVLLWWGIMEVFYRRKVFIRV